MLIEVQQSQEKSYLSMEELSADEVEYISETENIEKHPDTISMTEKVENAPELNFQEKVSSALIMWHILKSYRIVLSLTNFILY